MSRIFYLICSSLISTLFIPVTSQRLGARNVQQRVVVPDIPTLNPQSASVPQGLCRDGWIRGSMKDFSGKEIPICFRVNPEPQTWREAQASCRKDYGFLLKLDSRASVNNKDLLSSVLVNGITRFWSGMHTENDHLVWDDLIPNQVRPHNIINDSSVPVRPWRWHNTFLENNSEYCGQVNLLTNDNDDDRRRRRRKRSPDDDNPDFGNFDLSSMRNRFLSNAFSRNREKSRFPATSAFQSMLSRTQMSDQLPELPSTSLGIQSEHQLPGSGLSEANIQNGGLATDSGSLSSLLSNMESDGETSTSGIFGNTEMSSGDQMNTGNFPTQGILPTSSPELLNSVRDVASTLGGSLEGLQSPTPTETAMETLKKLIQGNSNNFPSESDNSDSASGPLNLLNAMNSESGTAVPIIPTPDTGSENKDQSSSDSSKSSSSDGIDISKLADMLKSDSTSSGDSNAKSEDSKKMDDSLSTGIVSPSINPSLLIPTMIDQDKLVDSVAGIAENTKDNIKDILDKSDSTLEKVAENIDESVSKVVNDIPSPISVNVESVLDNLNENSVSDSAEKVNSVLGDITDKTLETMTDTMSSVKDGIGGISIGNLESVNENAGESLIDNLENIPEKVEGITETIGESIADNIGLEPITSKDDVTADIPMSNVIEQIKENAEDSKPVEGDILSNLADNIESVKEDLNTGADDIATDVPDLADITEAVNNNIESVSDNMESPVHPFQPISDRLPTDPDLGEIGEVIQDKIEELPGIDVSADSVSNSLPEIFTEIAPELPEQSDGVENIIENMHEIKSDIAETTKGTISDMAEIGDNIDDSFGGQAQEMLPPPIILNEDAMESVTENLPEILETISDVQEEKGDTTEDIFGTDIAETTEGIGQQVISSSDIFNELDDNLPDSITEISDVDHVDVESITEPDDMLDTETKDRPEQTTVMDFVEDKLDDIGDTLGDKTEDRTEDTFHADIDKGTIFQETAEMPDSFNDVFDADNDFDSIFNDDKHDETELKEYEMDGTDNIGEVQHEVDDIAPLGDHFGDSVYGIQDIVEDGFHDTDDNADSDNDDHFDDIPTLSEDIMETARKAMVDPDIKAKEMELSTCEARLPSVCYTYEVEILDKASTCEDGWYGHVLLDACYKILTKKMSYSQAIGACKTLGGRLLMSSGEFERKSVLLAVQKEGSVGKDAKFWVESANDKTSCQFISARGVHSMQGCNAALNVVCVKDAKSLSVFTADNIPFVGETVFHNNEVSEERVFPSKQGGNKLPCDLTSAASEFPVLWFKDGVLVETKDKYVSADLSLYLNKDLVTAISTVLNRQLAAPALQGRYWCEVWDRQTLTRKRSKSYIVRFSDVITFHGSMILPRFTREQQLLFNMMNEKFPALSAVETDLKYIFRDALRTVTPHIPDVTDVFTFVDHVRSNPNVLEYHTYYTLSRDYTAQDESSVYNRLKSHLRTTLGNRNFMAQLPGMTPRQDFRTLSLQSTVACPATSLQTNKDLYGHVIPVKVFSFPRANLGEFANSVETCTPTSGLPAGTARCLGNFFTGAFWGDVVANECIDETPIDGFNNVTWGQSPFTNKLTEMAQQVVDARNVAKMVSEVAQISQVAKKFTPTDINKIADVLDHSTNVGKLPETVGKDMLKTVDKLMAASNNEVHVANVETKAANRIIKSLERYAENADIGRKNNLRFVSDNVVVEIWDLKPTAQPVIGLAAQSKNVATPFKTEDIATVYNRSHLYDAKVDAAIELPAEVFNRKEKGKSMTDRLTMMVFRKSKLFDAAISDGRRKSSLTDQQLDNLNSYVISASIAGKKIQDLKDSVKTIFKPLKDTGIETKCVWWDFDMNNQKGGWSSQGCVYDGKVNGRDVCLCNHLTNFAVLIDMYGQSERIPDHHELSLSIITVLGLSLSILGLALTIISYLFFRKLRQGRAQQTLFNLSLALLLSMLVFLVGIKQTHSDVVCKVVAILLHYLILVSFMWMLMEAILQYLTFVKILGTYITRFTLKTVVPAWGLPLIPVIAVLSVDPELYRGGPYYCWMALPAFYYSFVIPISCIILINVVIFFITIVSIFRRGKGLRSNQKKQKMAMTNLQAAITSFILLGLTWIFGYLAIADARLLFQYVFTILNSLQGFFIFVLFVLRKKKVREQWYFICCKGVEKDRVSRSLSASNSIPSTYSNGSNRNSRKTGRERDRSDSTKTVQSTYSNSSNGFTNYGYDHGYDYPFSRYDRRAFRKF